MGVALQSYSVTADEWTLIASNVSELSFQNIGQFPVYVNFSSAANTEPSSSVGLVYQPGNGELQKSLSELLYTTGGDLWYVWCKAVSKQSKVLATDGIELLARTIYPDATGKMILPTEARTTDLYAPDHEGVYRLFESGEPAVVGGRLVRNLATSSEDFTDASWNKQGTASVTANAGTAPDGSLTADRLTWSGTSSRSLYDSINDSPTGSFIFSIWLKNNGGTSKFRIRLYSNGGGTTYSADKTASSEWVRYSVAATLTTGATMNYSIETDSGNTADLDVLIWGAQLENATGRSDITTPSEYVSSDVGLAVYATENGNSVASNVVTEAVGSALSPAPYVLTTPGATNSCAYSQDVTGTGWSTAGTPTSAQDQTDIFGNANTAWTIGDDDAASAEAFSYTVTISDDSNTNSVRAWFKKTTSASSFPALQMRMTGGTQVDVAVIIDTDNGSLTDRTSNAPDSKSITDDGDYYKVTMSVANNGTGNTSLVMFLRPAVNTDASGSYVSSTTGSCVIDQAEIFLNTSNAVAHALPPIPTSGSASTIDITEVDEADAPTSNFVLKFKWTPEYDDQGTTWLIGNYTDANNAWGVLHDGTNIIFRNRVSGSNNDATKALNYVVGTEYEITVRHSTINGLDIWVDGTKGTNDSTTTDVTSAANTFFGQDGNDANAGINGFRAYRRWSIPANYSDAATVALAA